MKEEIVVYKKGSRGEVVGVYPDVKSLTRLEQQYNPNFKPTAIYTCLSGGKKSYFSFLHQCKAVPKLRKTGI